jgi:hypothetical protein
LCDGDVSKHQAVGHFHSALAPSAFAGATLTVCDDDGCTSTNQLQLVYSQDASGSANADPLTWTGTPNNNGTSFQVAVAVSSNAEHDGETFTVSITLADTNMVALSEQRTAHYTTSEPFGPECPKSVIGDMDPTTGTTSPSQ